MTSLRITTLLARTAASLALAASVASCASGPATNNLLMGVSTFDGKPDIVGNGGPQDDLARQMYSPGHDITQMLGGP